MTILAFIVAILILVSLHELGHYTVARMCGVKVKRFSVGFGKPLLTKKRGDTEWCIAPIPLGGYVKMVDTREGDVAEADLPYAFDKQHPAKRIAIVAAGPITNLVLAIFLYAFSFGMGITEIRPYVGTVAVDSVAERAGFQEGDKIHSVNGKPVANWEQAQTEIVFNLESQKVDVAVQTASGQEKVRTINIAGTPDADAVVAAQGNIGLLPYRLTNRIAVVAENSPAKRAGLQKDDILLAADGRRLNNWAEWAGLFRNSPGKKLEITVERKGEQHTVALRPDSVETAEGGLQGKVGLAPQTDEAWSQVVRYQYHPSFGETWRLAWEKTTDYIVLTVKFFGKLITGQASSKHISGPITIADVAGKSASYGLQSYLEFLAVVSISLGVLNLLPIPVLDGGHLVYYTAEWIRGKPLSERIQHLGLRFGLAAMLILMFIAFFNDITRLFGS